MAGIGFKLSQLARHGGIGGVVGAGVHGAVISSGPWLMTAAAMIALHQATQGSLDVDQRRFLQTILTYAFAASALVSAPIATLTTRAVADSLFAREERAVPGLLAVASVAVTTACLVAGLLLFGLLARLAPIDLALAIAILVSLGQIWVASVFLTATKRHWPVLGAFGAGIGVTAALASVVPQTPSLMLAAVAAGAIATGLCLLHSIGRDFPTAVTQWPDWRPRVKSGAHLAAAGLAAVVAVWIDKWVMWFAPEGMSPVGALRLNPIYDAAAFFGLLLVIPGLTLLVVTFETRFERAFGRFMQAAAEDGTLRGIEQARRRVAGTILETARLLVVVQATIGCVAWVMAPTLFEAIGADPRGIFAFRFTAIGLVFHLLATLATVVLSYYDLFGRILLVWGGMAFISFVAAMGDINSGYVHFGWAFMMGALAAALIGALAAGSATRRLTYLVFVGNNPAVMGDRRLWA